MPPFRKLLVANRGEIACRVMRTAQDMGYRTVAVYSEADRDAPHVRMADEAVCIGPARASESYLSATAILEAARKTGADAIHPGYGFLSENADFARACAASGCVFVGPPAEAIYLMGDKARAKARMADASVPTVPGFWGEPSVERLTEEAARVGYPLLVKATAGGGGRGIRLVRGPDALLDALASARVEAQSAFGDGTVMIERFIERGRHIEIQVFADNHGHAIFLGERDCTAQRRRQKVIEEAPSPIVSPEMRAAMGATAVAAALAVGYRGAGTVEFIVDQELRYYFLEMNTRLQVEHPVTELVTGLDLVRLQLLVAAGESLPIAQRDVVMTGHAIEARLYAEDPYAGFAPQTGEVLRFDAATAPMPAGIRIDSGIVAGSTVSPHYDAMVAKIIAHGSTRTEAIRRLRRALSDTPLFGPVNNARFLVDLLQTSEFERAEMHTGMLDEWVEQKHALLTAPEPSPEVWALAAALQSMGVGEQILRSPSVRSFELVLACRSDSRRLVVTQQPGHVDVSHGGQNTRLTLLGVGRGELRYALDGIERRIRFVRQKDSIHLAVEGCVHVFREPSALRTESVQTDPRWVIAPLAGVLSALRVGVGALVQQGDVIAVIEAMKMETRVLAPRNGVVAAIHGIPGAQVAAHERLMELAVNTEEVH